MKKTSRKVLGFICAIVLVITAVWAPMALSASAEDVTQVSTLVKNYLGGALKTPSANQTVQSFEDGLPAGSLEIHEYAETANALTAEISDKHVRTGSKAYHYMTYDASYKTAYVNLGSVTAGKTYVVDFYYLFDQEETIYGNGHGGNFNITVNTAAPDNYWTGTATAATAVVNTNCWEVVHSVANKTWHHASAKFTASVTNGVYLALNARDPICMSIYVDDISLTEVTDTKAVTTFHKVYSAWTNQTTDIVMAGEVGEDIDYAPTCTGREIVGWFSDEALTKPVSKYSKEVTDLYPLWASVCDFNSYPYKIHPEVDSHLYFGGALEITNAKGTGYDDDRALHIHLDQSANYVSCPNCAGKYTYSGDLEKDAPFGVACPDCGTPFTDEKNEDGKYKIGPTCWKDRCTWANPEHCAPIGTVDSDCDYLVSYYVKVDDITCEHTIRFYTSWDQNIWGGTKVITTGNNVIGVTDKGTGWQKFSAIIHTGENLGWQNGLFIDFIPVGQSATGLIDATVDNISITKITKGQKYILLNANADQSAESDFIIAVPGEPIDLTALKPMKGKAALKYWSVDPEGNTKVELPTVMPSDSVVLYANWGVDPVTFDGKYTVDLSNYLIFAKNFKLVSDGYDDNYAIRATYKGDKVESYKEDGSINQYSKDRYNGLDTVALLKDVKNHTAYKITYKYKVEKSNVNVAFSLCTCWNQNIWAGTAYNNNDEGTRIVAPGATDWKEITTYIYTEFPKTCGDSACGKTCVGDVEKCPYCGYQFKGDESYFFYSATGVFIQVNPTTDKKDGEYSILFDDFYIEEITDPVVMYNPTKVVSNDHAAGDAVVGSTVKNPAMTYFGRDLAGWYLDSAYTKPFTATTVDKPTLVYAKWVESDVKVYDFEEWYLRDTERVPSYYCTKVDAVQVPFNKALSGSHVIAFDRQMDKITNMGGCIAGVAKENQMCKLKEERMYIVEVNVFKARQSSNDFNMYVSAAMDINCYGSGGALYNTVKIKTTDPVGQWMKRTFYLDTHGMKTYANALFVIGNTGYDGLFYIDDVKVTLLPEDQSVVYVKNANSFPEVNVCKVGSDWRNTLPKAPKLADNMFLGYCEEKFDDEGNYVPCSEFTVTPGVTKIQAHWRRVKVSQSFEESFITRYNQYGGMSIMDFDYEIYDGSKTGNSADNVTNGKCSLHRMGKSMFKENVALLGVDDTIEAGAKYKITFDVKMDKYLQTDGAVKIVSGMSGTYPYTSMGDYYPVIAVKDLTDGAWHTVEYTFNSIQPFVSLQTPGYCSIYIDNVVIDLVDQDAITSIPVTFTEYVPALRDEKGNLVEEDTFGFIDVESIIDESLYSKSVGNFFKDNILWFGIGGGVIVLAAAAVVAILLIKKKKVKKA